MGWGGGGHGGNEGSDRPLNTGYTAALVMEGLILTILIRKGSKYVVHARFYTINFYLVFSLCVNKQQQ